MKEFPTMTVVVAVALVDAEGAVLMQRRPENRQHGGLWEFPGGKVERGESAVFALIRELKEELGVEVQPNALVPFVFAADGDGGAGGASGVVILLYTCTRWSGEPQNLDAQTIAWFAPAELCRLPMPPLDVPLAKRLEEAFK